MKIRGVGVTLLGLCVALGGCSNQLPALKPPKFDPDVIAQGALAKYDTNSDGTIDKSELLSAPAIKSALGRVDENGDDVVTEEEIKSFVQEKWIDSGSAIMTVTAEVYLNRRPLADATITLEPEPYLADLLHPATGVTDENGYALVSWAAENLPHENVRSGVGPGLYLVRISKEVGGKELIPAKYNTETTLGMEVAARASYMPGSVRFDLRK